MDTYNLIGYISYERPDYLFTGSENDLKDFIRRNTATSVYTYVSGRKMESISVAGYRLADLVVMINGPDVRTYLE